MVAFVSAGVKARPMIDGIDILTEHALDLLCRPESADELRDEYQRVGILQIEGCGETDRLAALARRVTARSGPAAVLTSKDHEVLRAGRRSVVSSGYRFRRIDPAYAASPPAAREAAEAVFSELGLTRLGRDLGARATPWLRRLTGRDLSFEQVFCFLYEAGDYIAMHSDAPSGERVNLQFPVLLDGIAAFRALNAGKMRLYADNPGCLRVIGPRVWHEVLPLLRTSPELEPRRLLLSFRFG